MMLIVERGEEEKDVLGDLRRVRNAKFGYRLTIQTYSLVSARPPGGRGGEEENGSEWNAPLRRVLFNSP
jgi:hypothetical protein